MKERIKALGLTEKCSEFTEMGVGCVFKTQYKAHRNQEKERSEAWPARN